MMFPRAMEKPYRTLTWNLCWNLAASKASAVVKGICRKEITLQEIIFRSMI